MAFPASLQGHLLGWLTGDPDQAILRWLFRSVLASTIALLAIDLAQVNGLIISAPVNDLQSRPEVADPSPLARCRLWWSPPPPSATSGWYRCRSRTTH